MSLCLVHRKRENEENLLIWKCSCTFHSICLPTCNILIATEQIYIKFNDWKFFKLWPFFILLKIRQQLFTLYLKTCMCFCIHFIYMYTWEKNIWNEACTFMLSTHFVCQSHWPRGLRRRSLTAHLLRLWVWIPPGAWVFVCCECYVLSGRGLCDRLITRPEESYRPWCVIVCDQETSKTRRLKPATRL